MHCAEQARRQVIAQEGRLTARRPSQALCSPLTAHDCEVLCQALKWHAPKAGLAGKELCNNRRCAQEEALLPTQLCSCCIALARPCRCGSIDGEGKGAASGPFYLGWLRSLEPCPPHALRVTGPAANFKCPGPFLVARGLIVRVWLVMRGILGPWC